MTIDRKTWDFMKSNFTTVSVLAGGIVWLTTMNNRGISNADVITEVKRKQELTAEKIAGMADTLSRVDERTKVIHQILKEESNGEGIRTKSVDR